MIEDAKNAADAAEDTLTSASRAVTAARAKLMKNKTNLVSQAAFTAARQNFDAALLASTKATNLYVRLLNKVAREEEAAMRAAMKAAMPVQYSLFAN